MIQWSVSIFNTFSIMWNWHNVNWRTLERPKREKKKKIMQKKSLSRTNDSHKTMADGKKKKGKMKILHPHVSIFPTILWVFFFFFFANKFFCHFFPHYAFDYLDRAHPLPASPLPLHSLLPFNNPTHRLCVYSLVHTTWRIKKRRDIFFFATKRKLWLSQMGCVFFYSP